MSDLELVPVTLADARKFVGAHHRHNLPPRGWKWGVAVRLDGEIVGVAVASRPVARKLDDGTTLEITRTRTTGAENANSRLYGACCRAAKALGYQSVITYTLPTESGASLKAAGFVLDAEITPPKNGWESRPGRESLDLFGNETKPSGPKNRWRRDLGRAL